MLHFVIFGSLWLKRSALEFYIRRCNQICFVQYTMFYNEKSKFYGILRENIDFEFSPRPILLYLVYKESILHVLSDPKIKLMEHSLWLILEAKNRYFHDFRDFGGQKSSRYR